MRHTLSLVCVASIAALVRGASLAAAAHLLGLGRRRSCMAAVAEAFGRLCVAAAAHLFGVTPIAVPSRVVRLAAAALASLGDNQAATHFGGPGSALFSQCASHFAALSARSVTHRYCAVREH
jgi:hypothetical protein